MSSVVVIFVLGLGLVFLLSRKGGDRGPGAEQVAAGLGFIQEAVERDTPVLDSKGPVTFARDKCDKYTTTRLPGRLGDWSLLQKFPEKGELPNGFALLADKPSGELAARVRPLAETFGYEYFEFERRGEALSFYVFAGSWGKKDIEKIAAALASLDGA